MVLHHDAGDFKGVIGINCILHALTVTSMNSLWCYCGSMIHKLMITSSYLYQAAPGIYIHTFYMITVKEIPWKRFLSWC